MEEEIDLREYINVMLKWKWLIIWITILAMVFAGILSCFVIRPVYSSSAILVPAVVNGQLIVKPQELNTYITNKVLSKDLGNSSLVSISADIIGSTNYVKITISSFDKNEIPMYFDTLLSLVDKQYENTYDINLNVLKSKLSAIKDDMVLLNGQEKEISKKISKGDLDDSAYVIALNTMYSILSKKEELNQNLLDLNKSISLSHSFYYLDKPVVPTRPIKPKKMFNIAVAGVAAFFFAVLLAFFLEYWQSGDDKSKLAESSK